MPRVNKTKHRPKKLSSETIFEIRRLYALGTTTQQELAKSFGVSQSLVSKIVNYYIHKSHSDFKMGGEAEVKIGFKYGN